MWKFSVTGAKNHKILLDTIQEEIPVRGKRYVKKLAEKFAEKIRADIDGQVRSWAPLSKAYLDHKRRKGLDLRILIARGDYMRSIQAREVNGGWEVAPSNDPIGEGRSETMKVLGTWLEFGTKNPDGTVKMPARPHWRPASMEFQKNISNTVRQMQLQMIQDFVFGGQPVEGVWTP